MIKKLGNCYLTRKLMAKLTHFSPKKKNFKKEKEKIGVSLLLSFTNYVYKDVVTTICFKL